MASQSEIAKFNSKVLVDEHVVRFDVSVHNAMAVQIGDDSDNLECDSASVRVREAGLAFMNQIEEGALLDQFHD